MTVHSGQACDCLCRSMCRERTRRYEPVLCEDRPGQTQRVPPASLAALAYLGEHPAATTRQLAAEFGLTTEQVRSVIRPLVGVGLIVNRDPERQRAVWVLAS